MSKRYTIISSPLGDILLAHQGEGITDISFQEGSSALAPAPDWQRADAEFTAVHSQLDAYFAGERHFFDLPLAPTGTPFQLDVWAALQEIPYGQTTTYGKLAQQLKLTNGARAVGAANGQNPLPIVIPCHRVIGSNGQLTGYRGGLRFKKALLALEQNGTIDTPQQLSLF